MNQVSDEISNLRQGWKRLNYLEDGSTWNVVCDLGEGNIRLFKDREGFIHLLIPTNKDFETLHELKTKALEISETKKHSEETEIRFLDLKCIEPRCNEVFGNISEEIVERILSGRPIIQAVSGVISEFKEMLANTAAESLSRSKRLGLIGELLFLKEIVSREPNALKNWFGPRNKAQDFYSPTTVVEVKCSESRGRIIKISSLEQLDPPPNKELFLVLYQVDEDPNGNFGLPNLIKEIINTGVDESYFKLKLNQAGYDLSKNDYYSKFKYNLRNTFCYFVNDTFPKLTRSRDNSSIPAQITIAKYEVNLNSDTPRTLSESEIEQVVIKMAEVA